MNAGKRKKVKISTKAKITKIETTTMQETQETLETEKDEGRFLPRHLNEDKRDTPGLALDANNIEGDTMRTRKTMKGVEVEAIVTGTINIIMRVEEDREEGKFDCFFNVYWF